MRPRTSVPSPFMLRLLMQQAVRLRESHPDRYQQAIALARRHFSGLLGLYPRPRGGEMQALGRVLRSAQWNMTYGARLEHERLESAFEEFVGVPHAVAVGSGGMGLQMAIRALGVRPADEVLLQVDTCSASAMSIMNTGATPVFTDIDPRTAMMNLESAARWQGPRTRAVLATHSWGQPENMAGVVEWARSRGLKVVEDACQALGAHSGARMAGQWGDAAVFSFGCLKPVQAGEGGIIVTHDEGLARELRSMRHYGERSFDFGTRETLVPAWNGRMSEFVAAVARVQLRHYPAHLQRLRENAAHFAEAVRDLEGLQLMWGAGRGPQDCAITQVVARVDSAVAGGKQALWKGLQERGIPCWHGNFELAPALGFFRDEAWRPWLPLADSARLAPNFQVAAHPESERFFNQTGIGFSRMNFMTRRNTRNLVRALQEILVRRR